MKIRVIRNALLVFGAASVGLWVGWLLFFPIFRWRGIGSGKVYEGAEAKLRVILDPIIVAAPHIVGVALAGLLLGCVTQGKPLRPWAIGLIAVFVAVTYGPALAFGTFFAGTAGPLLHSLDIIAICAFAPLGLWLGRRVKTDGAVA